MVIRDFTVMVKRVCSSSSTITVRVRHITTLPSGYDPIGVEYASSQKEARKLAEDKIRAIWKDT